MEDHLFLAVHNCLLNMFTFIFHTWKLSHLSAARMTHLTVVTDSLSTGHIHIFFKKITSLEWDIIIRITSGLSFMNQCFTAPLYAAVLSRSPSVYSSCVSQPLFMQQLCLITSPHRHKITTFHATACLFSCWTSYIASFE